MTDEAPNDQIERIIYLYRVTCQVNGKIYIGQSVQPSARWWQHRNDAADPHIPFHYAIRKYGSQNFDFEIIAACKGQDNANYLETELVKQYDSYISSGKGYNATHGGMNAPKTEAFKQMMRDWHASLTPEERAEISKQQSEATLQQIAEKGHPAQGTKRTEEQRAGMSIAQQAVENRFSPEALQRMSEAHKGKKPTEEARKKQSESATLDWEKRNAIREATGELKCNAPDCTVSGSKQAYKMIKGVRYCNKHGLRLWRYGRLDRINP